MTQKTIPFLDEKACCPFYALDPDSGLVVASVLTTSQEIGLRVAARLVAGQAVVLDDGSEGGLVLKRQKEIEIPLPKHPAQSKEDTPSIRYRASYTRTHPLRLETGVGYETCVLHRDATMYAAPNHWGYLLRLPGSNEPQFQDRFLHLWGRVTGLPARPAWALSLWNMGLRLELIVPLQAFGCQGWRIDPRWDRPNETAGWREVLKTIVLTKEVEQ